MRCFHVTSSMRPMGLIDIEPFHRRLAIYSCLTILLFVLSSAVLTGANVGVPSFCFYTLKALLLLAPIVFVRNPGYWLHPLIFIGVWDFVLVVLPESSLVINGLIYHPGLPNASTSALVDSVDKKLMMDCLAIMMTYFGFLLAKDIPAFRLTHPEPAALSLKLILITVVSFVGIMVLAKFSGGVEALALQRGLKTEERVFTQIGGGHWHLMAALIGPAVLIAAAIMKNPLRSPLFWLLLVLAMAGKFIVTGSRGGTLAILVLLFFILAARKNKIRVGRLIVFAFSIMLLVGVMSEFRTQSRDIFKSGQYNYQMGLLATFERAVVVFGKYSSQGNSDFPIYVMVPEEKPLLFGQSYFSMIVAPIPRAIWEDKPMGVGRLASETFMPFKQGGVPPSPAGEAYWNFHVFGVVFVFVLWGMFLQVFWKSVINRRMPGIIALYVITAFYLNPQTSDFYSWLHFFAQGVLVLMFFCINPLRWGASTDRQLGSNK